MVLIIVIVLQFPPVQNFLAQKGANFLQNKLNTRVEIAGFTTDFRNSLVLKGVYIEDQQQDTLWYSQRIGVDINLFSLLKSEVNLSSLVLSNATVHIYITMPDSSSNFDFIMDAFASDTTVAAAPADTTTQSAWKINVGTITLEDIFLTMQDEVSGNNIRARIGSFVTEMEEVNLDSSIYRIDQIDLRDSYANIIQTKVPPEQEEESEPLEMEFGLNQVSLANIRLNYENQVVGQRLALRLGESRMRADNIDLAEAQVDLRDFMLHNSDIMYVQEKGTPNDSLAINPQEVAEKIDESVEKEEGQPVNWVVNLDQLDVQGVNLQYDNQNEPRQAQGMDFNHLKFSNVVVDVRDLFYSLNRTTAAIQQVQLQEQSGFQIQNLTTDLVFDSTHLELANLDLQTGESRIRRYLALRYASLEEIADNVGDLYINADINNSSIGLQDALYFMPDLQANPSFRSIAGTSLSLNGRVVGPVSDLSIQNLQVSGMQGTVLQGGGTIQGLPDIDQLYLNLRINRFATTRTDVQALAPPGSLPPDIRIPPSMSMTGEFRGSLTNFDASTALATTYGNIEATIAMQPGANGGSETYQGEVQVTNLDLGEIMNQDTVMGQLTMRATVEGSGLAPEDMQARFEATVQQVEYNKYQYNNILVRGTAEQNVYEAFVAMSDENLAFALDGHFNLRQEQPEYRFTFDLEGADLQALHFYPDELRLQGQVVGQMEGTDLQEISGDLAVRELVVQNEGKTYNIDSVLIQLDNTPQQMNMQLQADFLQANFTSGNTLESLPEAINRYIDRYLRLPDADKRPAVELANLAFEMQILSTDLIRMFVPDLTRFEPGPIRGSYDQSADQLTINASIPAVTYAGIGIDSINFSIDGDQEQLAYALRVNEVADSSLLIQNISLTGSAQNDSLNVRFAIAGDTAETELIALGGMIQRLEDAYRFSFLPDDVVLNAQEWSASPDNFVQFGDGQIYANNVRLERSGSFVTVNSIGNLGDDGLPLEVAFNNFDLDYLVQAVQRNDSLLSGSLNGKFTLVDVSKNFTFTADLALNDLMYQAIPVGNVTLLANNNTANRYNVEIGLTGNGNQLSAKGFYQEQEATNIINLDVDIQPLNLGSLQGFTAGMVSEMSGTATGNLAIDGTVADPDIRGQLNFTQVAFNPTMLNSVFRLEDEALVFDEQGISFPNFTITDANNNQAVVTGQILTTTYTDYRFNLDVVTEQFLAMSSTEDSDELYYGTLLIDSDTRITGDLNLPVVRTNVKVLDGSSLTILLPNDEPGTVSREGIVEFVDMSAPPLNDMLQQVEADTTQTAFTGIDFAANIEVSESTPFTVIIDPVSGDNLVVQGNGEFSTGIDPSGMLSLSGRYELTEGSYRMTFYNLVSREFDIDPGSSITWAGDPMDATVDITAIYHARTAPMELVADQISGLDEAQRNRFRQQLPFLVYLQMEGQLMQPEISFAIELPEEERAGMEQVQTRLEMLEQNPSELNKQVFALLVLGRFIAEDPFASTGGGLASTARNSVSQLLSQQLNQLTENYLGGLGLEVGVESYEDFSTGSAEGRTELNLALRRQLFNDRVIVRVGGDIDVEGQRARQNKMSEIAGDVSVEYMITRDGRLRLRAFRRNDYEALEGDVQETGMGLIFMREYNDFNELFRSMEERNSNREKM